MYRQLKYLYLPLRSVFSNVKNQQKYFIDNVGIQNKLYSSYQPHFSKIGYNKVSNFV